MATHVVTLNLRDRASKGLGSINGKLGTVVGTKTIRVAMSGVSTVLGSIAKISTGLIALTAAYAGASAAFGAIGSGITSAAFREDAMARLETFLKSREKAAERMKELVKFSTTTPYTFEQVVSANLRAENMTGGDLSTMEGMTLLGNAASATGLELEVVTERLTKLWAAAKRGGSFGGELVELAALFDENTMAKLADISSGKIKGVAPQETLKIITNSLRNFDGQMAKTSQNWNGLISTMSDAWTELKVAIIAPIMDSLKPAIANITTFMGSLKKTAQEVGATIGSWVTTLVDIMSGDNPLMAFGETLSAIMAATASIFGKVLSKAVTTIMKPLNAVVQSFGRQFFGMLTNGSLWGSVWAAAATGILALGAKVIDWTIKIIATVLGLLTKLVSMIIPGDSFHDSVFSALADVTNFSDKNIGSVNLVNPKHFENIFDELGKGAAESTKKLFNDLDSMAPDVVDAFSDMGVMAAQAFGTEMGKLGFGKGGRPSSNTSESVGESVEAVAEKSAAYMGRSIKPFVKAAEDTKEYMSLFDDLHKNEGKNSGLKDMDLLYRQSRNIFDLKDYPTGGMFWKHAAVPSWDRYRTAVGVEQGPQTDRFWNMTAMQASREISLAPERAKSQASAVTEAIKAITDSLGATASKDIAKGAGYGAVDFDPLKAAADAQRDITMRQLEATYAGNSTLEKIFDFMRGKTTIGVFG